MHPITVCIPVYDDWGSLSRLLGELDAAVAGEAPYRVLIVDDASRTPAPPEVAEATLPVLGRPRIVRLRRNLGHQRAIAVGLSLLAAEGGEGPVVVLDGDGEDDPRDVPRLLARFRELGGRSSVFAARARRSERLLFRLGYRIYRVVHRVLTGIPVRIGNFSVLPRGHVETLAVAPELWSHYAAAAVKCGLPMDTVPANRAKRYAGRSKMNLVALVVHGLAALSVFADTVGVRLLLAAVALMGLSIAGLAAVVGIRAFTDLAVAGWATSAAGLLVVLTFQAFLMALTLVFVILAGRGTPGSPHPSGSDYRVLVEDAGAW